MKITNESEYENYLADQALIEQENAKELAKTNAKMELLNRLGITSDEAKLLLS